MVATTGDEQDGSSMLFADHIEERQMGEYVREFTFAEPVALQTVQILGRNERPFPGSAFEGKTFPNIRTMSLSVYAVDRLSTTSTMLKLNAGDLPGTFHPSSERLVTSCVSIRGEFLRISVVIHGQALGNGDSVPEPGQELSGVAPHLRPPAAHDADKLDLCDFEGHLGGEGELEKVLDGADAAVTIDASAPTSLARAVGISTLAEVNSRVLDHTSWIASLPGEPDVLEGEAVVTRLSSLVVDIASLAQKSPDTGASHISHGPVLARALLGLVTRCVERLEFRPLRAALSALGASLCAATTAAEVLRRGGLAQLLAVLRESEWSALSLKIAALEALQQLCTHAVGMEAFLGWSNAADAALPPQQTGYEVVMALLADGTPGQVRLERAAVSLLRRAGFYMALAKLDSGCARLATAEESGSDAATQEVLRGIVEALTDVAGQFEELSTASPASETRSNRDSLLDEEADVRPGQAALPSGSSDPFAESQPLLHGFLEAFVAGRRLMAGLCLLLQRLPRLPPSDRLQVFAQIRRLILAILACIGGAQFLASDPATLTTMVSLLDSGSNSGRSGPSRECSGLPSVPRFPEPLTRCAVGAPQLATMVTMHVRAVRLVLLLVAKTRQQGRNGLLPEADSLPFLRGLHQLCARGAAGRESVVCAFRSVFLVEWLLRQMEGRLEEQSPGLGPGAAGSGPSTRPSPCLRHLVALLHALVLGDTTASVAEGFGTQVLAVVLRALELLEVTAESAEGPESSAAGWGRPACASLEFALDSDGPEGGLGRAVRLGRRSADVACLAQLRELVAQLRPWVVAEGESGLTPGEPIPVPRLLACVQQLKAPRAFKRLTSEDRGSSLSLVLGGYGREAAGVEIPEVDYASGEGAEYGEPADDRERFPAGDLAQLPLLAMRLLCRRAAKGAREALTIALSEDRRSSTEGAPAKDGLAVLVPVLIRCAAALNLNLEARILREDAQPVACVYAMQQAHAQLLEATLQTCCHLIRGLHAAGLSQYRHRELLQTILLLTSRLGSVMTGAKPGASASSSDPEFRLLWRNCLVWTCRLFRTWVRCFASRTGGQLLQPLLRHSRVLPWHFAPGLLLLSTCGSLAPLFPAAPYTFTILPGRTPAEAQATGEQALLSQPLLLPAGARGGVPGHLSLRVQAQAQGQAANQGQAAQGFQGPAREEEEERLWGQLWAADSEAQDWDAAPEAGGPSHSRPDDPLIRSLSRQAQTADVATALSLVGRVNARKERLSMEDVAELCGLVAVSAMTSDALLHLITVRVLDKLTRFGIPVLGLVVQIGEATLHGVARNPTPGPSPAAEPQSEEGAQVGVLAILGPDDGAAGLGLPTAAGSREPRDGRAVSRLLMLLASFGSCSPAARRALAEHRVEALCLSILAQSPGTLPPMAVTQSIRVLSLMFCGQPAAEGKLELEGSYNQSESSGGGPGVAASVPAPSVPKYRMVSKALSRLINRTPEDGQLAGPSAIAAALGLLLRMTSMRSMCLNLLFSTAEEPAEGAQVGLPVQVAVSCAFKLAQSAQRLAKELSAADEAWVSTTRGTESEAEAEEALAAWLHVGELLVNLCQTVLVNCPTASVFLAVVLPSSVVLETMDEATLQSVLSDVQAVLTRITTRAQRAETVPLRAAALVGNLRALQRQLMDTKQGPPPTSLTSEELCPPRQVADRGAEPAQVPPRASGPEEDDILDEIVSLLESAAELESDPEWHAVCELDASDPPGPGSGAGPGGSNWDFDAAALRKRRQAALEKLESDRRAGKRAKATAQRPEAAPQERPGQRRRAESEGPPAGKASRPRTASQAPSAATAPAGTQGAAGTAGSAGTSTGTSTGTPTAGTGSQPPGERDRGAGTEGASPGAAPAAAAPAQASQGQVPRPAPQASGSASPETALQSFLKDHPEFMRVLNNPKKLSDPRVKSMFVKELQNYPAVKAFFATKGVVLN